MAQWNHFDESGNAVMVDVSGKEITARTATATGTIKVNQEIMDAVLGGTVKRVMCWVWHAWPGLWLQNRPGR